MATPTQWLKRISDLGAQYYNCLLYTSDAADE